MLIIFVAKYRDTDWKRTVVSKTINYRSLSKASSELQWELIHYIFGVRFCSQLTVESIIEHGWHINKLDS